LLRVSSAPGLDVVFEVVVAKDPVACWVIGRGMYVMGVDIPRAFNASCLDHSLAGGIGERIRCSTLVCDAERDMFFEGRPERFYGHLTCPRTLMVFTEEEGAGAHCHPGAMRLTRARICDWLDGTLAAGA
ncbi:dipeptidyl aminopeptidase, partial [Kitasatospora purpeofusca]